MNNNNNISNVGHLYDVSVFVELQFVCILHISTAGGYVWYPGLYFRPVVDAIYYLLADYYLKNKETM